MGNLADHRRLREEQGLYKEDPGDGVYTKDELDYIPFLGNNPSEERPAVYTARFRVSDGDIELEAKRSGGRLSITVECDEKLHRVVFECVERFTEAIFDGSKRAIKEAGPEDSKLTKLSKELSEVTKERDEIKETLATLRKALHQ